MCYAASGPRCSGHAKKLLEVAGRNYTDNPTFENREKLQIALEEFEATPAGFRSLKNQITQYADGQWDLEDRLERGRERRKAALAAIHAKDAGDEGESEHYSDEVSSTNYPTHVISTLSAIQSGNQAEAEKEIGATLVQSAPTNPSALQDAFRTGSDSFAAIADEDGLDERGKTYAEEYGFAADVIQDIKNAGYSDFQRERSNTARRIRKATYEPVFS